MRAVALVAGTTGGGTGAQLLAPPHSVSGFSGGASVAVNHLVAFSDIVVGLGIIGGSPYGCSQLPDCGNTCSGYQSSTKHHLENTSIPWNSWVDGLRGGYIAQRARAGQVAPLSHLASKPVYLFSGLDDVYVYQSVMRAVDYQFRSFSSRVKSEFSLYAAHAWVVDNATCPHPGAAAIGKRAQEHAQCCGIKGQVGSCAFEGKVAAPFLPQGCCGTCSAGDVSSGNTALASISCRHLLTRFRCPLQQDNRNETRIPMSPGWRPPINNCDYDMSGEILRWVHGTEVVRARRPVVPGNLIAVNQSSFLSTNWTVEKALLDPLGYVYVPQACRLANQSMHGVPEGMSVQPLFAANCSIHVHYHPCGGSIRDVGLSYMLENALPAYAEANNMVIVYPQSGSVNNPAGAGCFDWYGAVGQDFDTRTGIQLNFVLRMIRELQEAA